MKSNRELFRDEINRIKRLMNHAIKEGYKVPEDVVPITPSRVTKEALDKVKSIKAKDIYKPEYKIGTKGTESKTDNKSNIKQSAQKVEPITPKKPSTEELEPRKGRMSSKPIKEPDISTSEPSKPVKIQKPITKDNTKQVPSQDYPTISIIERIKEKIRNIERYTYPQYPLDNRKGALLAIFENTIYRYEVEEDIGSLESYLQENESQIDDLLSIVMYDSNGEDVNASFAQLGKLLNVESLSPDQAESLSYATEMYGNDYDFWGDNLEQF